MTVDIRPWAEGDLPLLQRLMGDPEMTAHLGGPESPAKIRSRHEKYCQLADTGTGRMFVIVAGDDQTPAGSIGYWEREWQEDTVWETGWSVLPEFQGQGVATGAVAVMLGWARREDKHRYVMAYPSVDNGPSNAICRKASFTLLGEEQYEYPPGNPIHCNNWRFDLSTGS